MPSPDSWSFSGAFDRFEGTSTSAKAIFESTHSYTLDWDDEDATWGSAQTHVRTFSGTARNTTGSMLAQDISLDFGAGDFYERYEYANGAQTVMHSFGASGSSYIDVVQTESIASENWWYAHSVGEYLDADAGSSSTLWSSTPSTSPTEFALLVNYPDLINPGIDAVINLAIHPDWEANLGYVDANGYMKHNNAVEDLLLKDFAAGKGPAQGAKDDQLRAKAKLRTGAGNQPDLREAE